MRRMEVKTCKKCGRTYLWESGGIVATPGDYMDCGMCPACRIRVPGRALKRIGDIIRGKGGLNHWIL